MDLPGPGGRRAVFGADKKEEWLRTRAVSLLTAWKITHEPVDFVPLCSLSSRGWSKWLGGFFIFRDRQRGLRRGPHQPCSQLHFARLWQEKDENGQNSSGRVQDPVDEDRRVANRILGGVAARESVTAAGRLERRLGSR